PLISNLSLHDALPISKDQYLAQLETHLQSQQEATTGAKVQQPATLKRGLSFVLDQLNSGYLGQYEWSVRLRKGTPVSIRLEMNLDRKSTRLNSSHVSI